MATGDSAAEDLNTLLLSGSGIIKRVANPAWRVHTTAEELQILQDFESRVNAFHADSRSTLRFRHNQLSQINALPDEILLMIFLYAKNDEISREMLQYLPLTWICRRWRFLAVNSPVLWTLLDYSYDKDVVLEEIIRRSKGSKIWVGPLGRKHGSSRRSPGIMGWSQHHCDSFGRSDPGFENFKRFIIPVLSRVDALHLILRENHLQDALLLLQKNLSPSIRRCQLHMDGAKSESVLTELVFSKIFNSQALEVLHIYSDYLSLSQTVVEPLVLNLRCLLLKTCTSTPDLPALQDLLRILQSCCSSLETLEIITLRTKSSTSFLHPKIDMTHLTSIQLSNPADVQIMEYLSTPALQWLSLDGRGLSKISPLAYLETLPFMKLEDSWVKGYREDIDGHRKIGLIMDLSHDGSGNEEMLALAPHFEKWANHLSSFELKERFRPISSTVPRFILMHAHRLRNLCIETDWKDILPLLEESTTCPQLESLTYTSQEGKPGKRLLSIVRLRHKSGTPLRQLTLFAKHPVARTHEEKLKRLVDFVFNSIT